MESDIRNRKSNIVDVLLIEDDEEDVMLLREMLDEAGRSLFNLECADRLQAGLEYLAKNPVDVIMLDLNLLDSYGLETIDAVAAQAPELPILVLTGLDDEMLGVKALQKGAQDYLVKGRVNGDLLTRSIRYAIERHLMLMELKHHAEELHASEERLHAIIEQNADAMLVINQDGIILFANPAAELLFGCAADKLPGELFSFPLAATGGKEIHIPRKDDKTAIAEIRVTNIQWEGKGAYLACLRDITQRKQMEEELLKIQKLESIGILAGGIAHDLNNFLTAIVGNISLAMMNECPLEKMWK